MHVFTFLVIIIIFAVLMYLSYINYNKKRDAAQARALLLQKLWAEHMWYTREYLIRVVYKLPDASDVATRLLQNQSDLANAVNSIYPGTYNTVYVLLKDHILIAVQLVNAVIAGDASVDQVKQLWFQNGEQIADALASLNKKYKKEKLHIMLKVHLETTVDELVALVARKSGVIEYDKAFAHMMMFSAYLLEV